MIYHNNFKYDSINFHKQMKQQQKYQSLGIAASRTGFKYLPWNKALIDF